MTARKPRKSVARLAEKQSAPNASTRLRWDDVAPALALVSEARQLFGKRRAAGLWRSLGLPEASLDPPVRERPPGREAISKFLADRTCIELAPCEEAGATALYVAYATWCARRRSVPESQTAFGRELTQLGYRKLKQHGCVFYRGIALRRSPRTPSGDV